jgi:hypothetical protein
MDFRVADSKQVESDGFAHYSKLSGYVNSNLGGNAMTRPLIFKGRFLF